MERPDNLLCDPPHKSAAENKQPFIATVSSSSSSSSSSSTKDNHEAVVRAIQQRPLRFRYPLVSLKRLKTLGPARRVLVSNTEVDNSLPKISEEENNVSPDQSYSSEKEQIEASTQCPRFADDSSPKTEEEVSTLDESNAYGDIAGGNNEPPEHRKRKADMETIGEDATISLTVNAGSSGSPNQNNADLRLDHDKRDYFGTGGLDSEGSFQKSMAEHNISVNSYSASDEVELDFANGKIDEAAGSKFHLNQPEKLYNVSIRSDYPKPMVQDEPKKVHFATVDYSNRGDGAVFPNSSIMGMEHKQAHVVFDSHQMHLKPRSLLNLSSDGRSAPLISSVKDDSIQSKPNPALISEPKNKEKIVRRAHSVGYYFALGCIDTLKSDCNISDADVKPNLSYNTHLLSTAEADRLLDSMSSTPLVSVNSEVCEKVATDTGMENLSSHLNSLALTENQESGSLSNLGESFASHRQILNQAGASSAAKCDGFSKMEQTTKTNVTVTTAPAAAVDQILKPSINSTSGMEVNSSLTLPAFAALSCTTSAFGMSNSTSVQCTSVLSTLSSVQNLGPCKGLVSGGERGAVGESSRNSSHSDPHAGLDDSERRFNLNLYNSSAPSASIFPCTSSLFGCQSATSIRCTSGPLTSLSVGQGLNMSREQSTTAKTNSRRSLSEELSNARLQESRMVMRSTEEILPQEPCVKETSQLPEVAGCLNQSIQQSSSQGDLEKNSAGNSRETSTSRKKYYDSDAFFRVNNKFYQKLGKIGSGGSSEVHKVISSDCTIYALKAIKLKGRDYSSAYGFCQEIDYLTRLRGKNYIIQLIDYEVTDKNLFRDVIGGNSGLKDARINEDAYIYMVLEYGEIDLAQMLLQKRKEMDAGDKQIDENWLRFYWQQILKAVNTIHEERIVHSDLKPANFLLVKGVLKLIDFGIAKAIQSDTTNIQRESQVGTLNYMSPEAFLCNDEDENGNIIKCGRPSDIWSLGCILYQMVYGKTPFAGLTSLWAKYKEITNKDHKITYGPVSNPWLLDIMKKCLVWNRNERLRIPQLLGHPFLRPPAPPSMLTQEERHHIALVEISDAYGSDGEIRSLCEKLQEQIRNLSKPSNS